MGNRVSRAQFTAMSFILVAFSVSVSSQAQDEELNVIQDKSQWLQFTDAQNSLYHHFANEAYDYLEARKKLIDDIQSLEEWKARQHWIRKTLLEVVGPFPERTPLNARVTRTVEKDGYRIEHIVYESRPQFFVTASLYVPSSLKRRDRAPAIIYCSGHSDNGYRSKVYQHVIVNLVRKGFVVFAFDPVGQGERLQYFDAEKGQSFVGGPTSEHSYPGSQAFVAGTGQANYMTWDGIRAVDYLLTRREVDAARIGITGRSGGGTQTAYVAAIDDRIKAAAPECYITNFTRLLQSIGPQDAEQNFSQGISKGLDHADLLLVRAPKPTLMVTTTRDMFSIQGARETAAEVSRIYKAYEQDDDFSMVEDDAPHASTKKNREAMYAFFREHLNNPGPASDEDVEIPSEPDLIVTTSGQVSTSLGGETLHTLNIKGLREKINTLYAARRNSTHLKEVVGKAKTLSGYRDPSENPSPVFTGRLQRDGYTIEKYFVRGEGNYVIPYLLIAPDQGSARTILYLHPDGKKAEAGPGGKIESLVKKGFTVLAPDLVGTGEMGAGDFQGDAYIGGVSHNIWYAGILVGRSITGLRAGDIARLVNVIKQKSPDDMIYAIAQGEMAPVLLHAAAFTPGIKKIALVRPLLSYTSLAQQRIYHSEFIPVAVAGSLTAYDLPDLAASLAPRELLIINPVNGNNQPIAKEEAEDLDFIRQSFASHGNEKALSIIQNADEKEALIQEAWLE